MSNVLVIGGTGYIGLAVSQALVRSGNYTVFATTRDAAKRKNLLLNEITPLVGQISDSNFIKSSIKENRIDAVIDLSQAPGDAATILSSVVEAADERKKTLSAEKAVGPKLGFAYGSGVWVHGSGANTRMNDLNVPGTSLAVDKPATAVSWRPAHEQAVLAARDVLNVAILRPGDVYGRSSYVFGAWWGAILAATKNANAEDIVVSTNEDARPGIVHVDDVADAYVRAIDRLPSLGSWPVYDIVSETVPAKIVLEEVKRILGAKGKLVYSGTHQSAFLEALALVTNGSSARARTELGWNPSRREFIRDLPQLVAAWQASLE